MKYAAYVYMGLASMTIRAYHNGRFDERLETFVQAGKRVQDPHSSTTGIPDNSTSPTPVIRPSVLAVPT